jgi:hypothetical protein
MIGFACRLQGIFSHVVCGQKPNCWPTYFYFWNPFQIDRKLLTNCKMHSFLFCRKYILMYFNWHDSKYFISYTHINMTSTKGH